MSILNNSPCKTLRLNTNMLVCLCLTWTKNCTSESISEAQFFCWIISSSTTLITINGQLGTYYPAIGRKDNVTLFSTPHASRALPRLLILPVIFRLFSLDGMGLQPANNLAAEVIRHWCRSCYLCFSNLVDMNSRSNCTASS